MARLPPSRDALHRGLRIPGLQAGDDSPSKDRAAKLLPQFALGEVHQPRGSAVAA
jgi:hypothetical protein